MAAARYARPTDEIGHSATVTLSTGTANANYPVTNVQNFFPDKVFLTTTTTAVRIVWDHGTAVDVQLFSLHHYNIPAGHSGVKFQRNATDSWATPTIDATVVIPTYPNPGLPLPIGLDVTAQSGYSAGGFRYSSLLIPSPSQLTGIGSALLWSTKREDISNVTYPAGDQERHPRRQFETAYGHVKEYRLGVRLRRHPSAFRLINATRDAAFLALFRSCQDGSNAFLWWRDTTNSDAMLARFPDDLLDRPVVFQARQVSIPFHEMACGVAIPTS